MWGYTEFMQTCAEIELLTWTNTGIRSGSSVSEHPDPLPDSSYPVLIEWTEHNLSCRLCKNAQPLKMDTTQVNVCAGLNLGKLVASQHHSIASRSDSPNYFCWMPVCLGVKGHRDALCISSKDSQSDLTDCLYWQTLNHISENLELSLLDPLKDVFYFKILLQYAVAYGKRGFTSTCFPWMSCELSANENHFLITEWNR